jgi:hypothetical protein
VVLIILLAVEVVVPAANQIHLLAAMVVPVAVELGVDMHNQEVQIDNR